MRNFVAGASILSIVPLRRALSFEQRAIGPGGVDFLDLNPSALAFNTWSARGGQRRWTARELPTIPLRGSQLACLDQAIEQETNRIA